MQELDTIDETILVPENLLPADRDSLFVGRVADASMTDIIPDGLLLQVAKEPARGRVYVFTLRGQRATIKKFHIDHTGPHFKYMGVSGRSIYSGQHYCHAEFLAVLWGGWATPRLGA